MAKIIPGFKLLPVTDKNGRLTNAQYKVQTESPESVVLTSEAPAKFDLSLAGPSTITRGSGVGYSVSASHMSREFVDVEDRETVADRLASEFRASIEADGKNSADYAASHPGHWMEQFEAYDIFEAEAPAGFTEAQRQGFESVSLKSLGLDLDHQSLHYNAFTVSKNEVLAKNVDAPYRRGSTPEHQARLDEFWDARADRLSAVREQLEDLDSRRSTQQAARLRDNYRPDLESKSGMDLIRWMDVATNADLFKPHAELLADHTDVRVARVLARSKHRSQLDSDYQEKLRNHSDEAVRTNFLTENMQLTPAQLFASAENDPSGYARMAAQNELNERGVYAKRISPTSVSFDTVR